MWDFVFVLCRSIFPLTSCVLVNIFAYAGEAESSEERLEARVDPEEVPSSGQLTMDKV